MAANGELTVRVEPPDPPEVSVTIVGFTDALEPEGAIEAESVTVPAKPLMLFSRIDEVPEEPTRIVRDVGLRDTVKSTTLTVICTE